MHAMYTYTQIYLYIFVLSENDMLSWLFTLCFMATGGLGHIRDLTGHDRSMTHKKLKSRRSKVSVIVAIHDLVATIRHHVSR